MPKKLDKKKIAEWIQEFEPVWITGAWLGEDAWIEGLDRMTSLGIEHYRVWQVSEGEDKSLVLSPGIDGTLEHSGFIVALSDSARTGVFTRRPQRFETTNPDGLCVGFFHECESCDGEGKASSGNDCKKCKGVGQKFDLDENLAGLPSRVSDLEKMFSGEARFKKEIALVKEWQKKFKPIFWAGDEAIEDALAELDRLNVDTEHLWTGTYQYGEHVLGDRSVPMILSDYDPDAESAGSLILYVTANPCQETFGCIKLSDGYSCMECSGKDSDCEACGGEEETYVDFGPYGVSNDITVLQKFFG